MDKMMMNKLDDKEMELDNMEMDKVSGGFDSNANSMAANVDETQMELPIGGGHKINV